MKIYLQAPPCSKGMVKVTSTFQTLWIWPVEGEFPAYHQAPKPKESSNFLKTSGFKTPAVDLGEIKPGQFRVTFYFDSQLCQFVTLFLSSHLVNSHSKDHLHYLFARRIFQSKKQTFLPYSNVPQKSVHPKNPWDVMGCQNHLFWGLRGVMNGGSGVFIGGFKILRAWIPSLPNTLWLGIWTHKHLLRRPFGGPNTYSQGIWGILEN